MRAGMGGRKQRGLPRVECKQRQHHAEHAGHAEHQGHAALLPGAVPFTDCLGARAGCHERDRQELGERARSEEHTSELQSLLRISYAVFCLKKNRQKTLYIHTYMTTVKPK